eukprot:scaffold2631_cov412-Prasinococcus_capsulatus_cf.AAC.14
MMTWRTINDDSSVMMMSRLREGEPRGDEPCHEWLARVTAPRRPSPQVSSSSSSSRVGCERGASYRRAARVARPRLLVEHTEGYEQSQAHTAGGEGAAAGACQCRRYVYSFRQASPRAQHPARLVQGARAQVGEAVGQVGHTHLRGDALVALGPLRSGPGGRYRRAGGAKGGQIPPYRACKGPTETARPSGQG